MTKYILTTFGHAIIKEIDVIKESEHSVWYKSTSGREVMIRKTSNGMRVFDDYNEAVLYGRAYYQETIRRAKVQLVEHERRLNEFNHKYPSKDPAKEATNG